VLCHGLFHGAYDSCPIFLGLLLYVVVFVMVVVGLFQPAIFIWFQDIHLRLALALGTLKATTKHVGVFLASQTDWTDDLKLSAEGGNQLSVMFIALDGKLSN